MRKLISKFPMVSNMALYSVLYGAGDVTRQLISQEAPPDSDKSGNKLALIDRIDRKSAAQMALVGGLCMCPFNFIWLRKLDRFIPSKETRSVIKKVVLDQAVAGPVGIIIFYTGMGYLQDTNVIQELSEKFLKTYMTGCVFWPCAQAFNFSIIPSHLRAPYVGCVAFIWTAILSYFKSQKTDKSEENSSLSIQEPCTSGSS